jgi:glycosyltransferase involved in cell wall biosynthesis
MDKLKILIVQELWWPKGGGGMLATHLITKMLARRGFEVKVVTGVKDYEVINGVEFIYEPRLKAGNKLRLWLNTYALCREDWFRRLVEWADVVYVPRYAYPVIPMAKALKRRVVVHLHDYQPISYTAVIFHNDRFRSDFTRTFYYESHQHGLAKALITSPLTPINRLARRWVSQADMIICVSNRQREIIEKAMPEVKGRTTVIYNPLPNVPFVDKKLADEKVLLYLGGSSFVKGFHIVLKAIDEVLKRHRNLEIIMTRVKRGDVPIQNCVVYEELPYEEIVKLHEKAYALLFPSIWEEPLPYAVIESMLMGTIPIAARVGGVSEIVKGTPAEDYLFSPGSIDEFVDKVEMLLSQSRDNIMDVGMKLREHALELFNEEEIENKVTSLFESMLSQGNAK